MTFSMIDPNIFSSAVAASESIDYLPAFNDRSIFDPPRSGHQTLHFQNFRFHFSHCLLPCHFSQISFLVLLFQFANSSFLFIYSFFISHCFCLMLHIHNRISVLCIFVQGYLRSVSVFVLSNQACVSQRFAFYILGKVLFLNCFDEIIFLFFEIINFSLKFFKNFACLWVRITDYIHLVFQIVVICLNIKLFFVCDVYVVTYSPI